MFHYWATFKPSIKKCIVLQAIKRGFYRVNAFDGCSLGERDRQRQGESVCVCVCVHKLISKLCVESSCNLNYYTLLYQVDSWMRKERKREKKRRERKESRERMKK